MTGQLELLRLLSEPEPVLLRLALVVERNGSAPCRVGDLLVLLPDGQVYGTVGGGILEQQVTEGLQQLASAHGGQLRQFRLVPEQNGMSCGGTVSVLLAGVGRDLRTYFAALFSHLRQGTSAQLRVAVGDSGQLVWLSPDQVGESGQLIEVTLHPDPCLLIFGAGHITQALAPMAQLSGFTVTVLDDRPDYLTAHPFAEGIEVVTLESFEKALHTVQTDVNCFLVIATYGHIHDLTVLEQALATDARYIGMVGSRRKREELFGGLRQAGCSETDLARVYCPVGLAIGAATPAEIAVSILAQMIAVRRANQ